MFQKSIQPLLQKALELVRNAGYSSFTRFQEAVIPVLLKGMDIVAETRYGEGRAAGFIVPLIVKAGHFGGKGPYGLIICNNPESASKITGQVSRFLRGNPVPYLKLGHDTAITKEVRQLQNDNRLIIATARRTIDHLRRNTLLLSHLRCVIIYCETEVIFPGFERDIHFILSKTARKVQAGIFCPDISAVENLLAFLKRPKIIQCSDCNTGNPVYSFFTVQDRSGKARIFEDLFTVKHYRAAAVYCRTMAALKVCEKACTHAARPSAIISPATSEQNRQRILSRFESARDTVILTICADLLPRIPALENVVFFDIPQDTHVYSLICDNMTQKLSPRITSFFLVPGEQQLLNELQEKYTMKKEKNTADAEMLKGRLESIVKRIHEVDPDTLQIYKKLINKHVPLTRRAYVGALLLMESTGGPLKTAKSPQTTLFVNIGKNRRVFPRDLSRFFSTTLGIRQDEIGPVRVFDNYSFVEVPETVSSRAVKEMDGIEYRGRKIVVNFAKKKENQT